MKQIETQLWRCRVICYIPNDNAFTCFFFKCAINVSEYWSDNKKGQSRETDNIQDEENQSKNTT